MCLLRDALASYFYILLYLSVMSVCVDGTRVCPVSWCGTNITIGTIDNLSTSIYIYVRRIDNGRTHRESTTTDGSGTVTKLLTDPGNQFYNSSSDYEVWVTLQTSDNPNDARETITLDDGTTQDTCFILTFESYKDQDGNNVSYTTQILSV